MSKFFRLLINILLTLASLAYPLGWLLLPTEQDLSKLIIVIAILWSCNAIQAVSWQRYFAIFMAGLLVVVYITQTLDTMFWYPIIINGMLLTTFGASLFSSQSLVERLARLQTPDLPPQGVRYTRKVTQVWCGFFIFNIAVCSILIVFEKYNWWAIYTGAISYGLMGLLMIGEWIIRQRVIKNG